jgi:hypothetical protein
MGDTVCECCRCSVAREIGKMLYRHHRYFCGHDCRKAHEQAFGLLPEPYDTGRISPGDTEEEKLAA